ncbi:MAG TPA: outer membrane protein [Xanthobacteraceae bacterium]|nr:outer membrane protein [Xanthobacteraceae bacterium]
MVYSADSADFYLEAHKETGDFMHRALFATAAAALALLATPALASDLPPSAMPTARAAPRPVGYNWNGFYAGGNIGYSWGKWDSTGAVVNGSDSPSVNGMIGGLQLGYNWMQINRWLLGLEADIQISGERKSTDWVTAAGFTFAGLPVAGTAVHNAWKFPWFGTVRGRIGYAPDNWLLYFTGGLAYGQTKSEITTPTVSMSDSVTKWGWTIGGGVEAPVAAQWTAKIEYLYIDLGSRTFFAGTTLPVSSNLHDNVIRLGVNYKFQ